MGYHQRDIKKGVYGTYSKIQEEFEEFTDAYEQKDRILQLCELSDLIGAIEEYTIKSFNMTLEDLILFSNKTKSAFKENKRC
jgi:phosphoribosyl-ATP pyrophosphohydrolase